MDLMLGQAVKKGAKNVNFGVWVKRNPGMGLAKIPKSFWDEGN